MLGGLRNEDLNGLCRSLVDNHAIRWSLKLILVFLVLLLLLLVLSLLVLASQIIKKKKVFPEKTREAKFCL